MISKLSETENLNNTRLFRKIKEPISNNEINELHLTFGAYYDITYINFIKTIS